MLSREENWNICLAKIRSPYDPVSTLDDTTVVLGRADTMKEDSLSVCLFCLRARCAKIKHV